MPQLKKPATLYNFAFLKTRLWIVSIATTIHQSYGSYDSEDCQQTIKQFNQYLISSVPSDIIDELYNSSNLLCDPQVEQCQNNILEKQVLFDHRILLSLYLNKNMKTLTAHKLINDNFWKSNLCFIGNLTRLDLSKVCTDEILEVVGKHCIRLEFINIVSKSCHTRTKDRHNALKLQLCVSDSGLDFISNCKQLKEIHMTCIIRKGCGGRQITNEGIKRLLLTLPGLKRINYTDTGMLLDSLCPRDGHLALVSVIDYHPQAARIPKVASLCPNLSELHLTYAFSLDDYRGEVISALSSSDLKISVLSLTNFPFDDYLKKFFEKKGSNLIVLNFVSSFIQSSFNELFRLLSWTCNNLECMNMHFNMFDSGYNSNQNTFNLSVNNCSEFFSKLKTITIKGNYWDSKCILPLLLRNATFINKIVLSNHTYSGCLEETLHQIQQFNSFSYLETVSFLKGVNVSVQFLRDFIMTCPVIKNLSIANESQAFLESVVQLRHEFLSRNFDVNIVVYATC